MSKWINFNKKIDELAFKVLSDQKDFASNDIKFECDLGHVCEMKYTSFKNKKAGTYCKSCTKDTILENNKKKYTELCENVGFTFLDYLPETRQILYICNCGEENTTSDTSIKRSKGCCSKCQNNKNRNNPQIILDFFEKANLKLHNISQYTGNRSKLDYTCSCGKENTATYHDLAKNFYNNEHVGCMSCRNSRTALKKTDGKYINVFQIPEIKEKSKQTNLTNHGVEYPLQSKKIRTKVETTNEKKYGTKWAFTQKYVLEKIKQINMERWGVENCFNSPEFHKEFKEKLDNVCMEKYGAIRYGCSDAMKKDMLDRFGNEYYLCSDTMKKDMLERFGNEYYVCSDTMKKDMLDRFGYEYAIQNSVIFRKAMKKMYSKKQYKLPSGLNVEVMGYEPLCLDILFGITKTDLYTNIHEENEICVEVEPIDYFDEEKKNRVYFPDISINSNIIIEVKSVWTFNKDLERNKCKFMTASKNPDINFQVWIFNKKKLVLIIMYKDGVGYINDKLYDGNEFSIDNVYLEEPDEIIKEHLDNLL